MKKQISKYEQQANEFAAKYNLTMRAVYLGHYARFSDYVTAVFRVTLERPNKKPFCFDFSTSINDSYVYRELGKATLYPGLPPRIDYNKWFANGRKMSIKQYDITERKTPPTLYDVLACLTKYDPETFEDFCSEYGYDTDSRKAYDTFQAVDKEWHEVKRLFSDCLDELAEIN